MFFPYYRSRRMRLNIGIRKMVRETFLSVNDLIYPVFVTEGKGIKENIESMPGQYRCSIDVLINMSKEVYALGIPAIILFGIPSKKDSLGTGAYACDGIVQRAIKSLKDEVPELVIITDVCLCQYIDHGHCGYIKNGVVDNDITLDLISEIALSQVESGADIVAPSDMMDGRVSKIRNVLDKNGKEYVPIMSYSVKYCSSCYGPFRDAASSSPKFGDRRTYQMDIANSREAIREVSLDVSEGADVVIVKPALFYLDIINDVRRKFDLPIAAYNVSGEYSMIKAADKMGWVDGNLLMMELLTSIKRAGADMIITYFAIEAAMIINNT